MRKKKTLIILVLVGIFLTVGLALIGVKNKAKKTYYSPPEINFVNSVPAGTVARNQLSCRQTQ